MEKITVRVTKSSKPLFWYSDKVGEEFEVCDFSDTDFVLWKHKDSSYKNCIRKSDCEVIANTHPSPLTGTVDGSFEDFMRNARNEFVDEINEQKWNTKLRTTAEDFLICFDQMRAKIESIPKGTVDESAKENELEEKIMKIEQIIDEIEIDSERLFSSSDVRKAAIKIISLLSKQSHIDESKGLKSKEEIYREVYGREITPSPQMDRCMELYASQFRSSQGLIEALEKIRDMLYDASNYSHCCYSFKSKQELLSIVKEAIVQHNTLPAAPSVGVEELAHKYAKEVFGRPVI